MARILAYDALMWDNALASYEGRPVRVPDRRRGFVGKDRRRFGSPEHPCPRLGLLPGDGCDAVAFEVPRSDRRYLLHNLKQRERRTLTRLRAVEAGGRRRRVRAFLPARYERIWPDAASVIEALRHARGLVGTGAEYIRTTVHAMELWEIEDPAVAEVWEEVRGRTAGRWESRAS